MQHRRVRVGVKRKSVEFVQLTKISFNKDSDVSTGMRIIGKTRLE